MTDKELQEFDRLEQMSLPLQQYLTEKHHPYCAIVVTFDDVRVVESKLKIPLPSDER